MKALFINFYCILFMKIKNFVFLVVFLSVNFSHSQCGNYSEIISQSIEKVNFWDDNFGYGIGGAKLMMTQDGGNTWSDYRLPDFRTIFNFPLLDTKIIDNNSAIIVGFNGHILLTNDKGVTWQERSVEYDGRESLTSVDFISNTTGFLVGFNFGETNLLFYKTTDGGNTWINVQTSLTFSNLNFGSNEIKICKIHFINESIGFLWKRNSLFKTTNGGINWVQIQYPQNDGIIINIKSIDNEVYMTLDDFASSAQLYKSNNFGDDWIYVSEFDCLTENSYCLATGEFEIRNNYLYAQIKNGDFSTSKLVKFDVVSNTITHTDLEEDLGFLNDICFYEDNKAVLVGGGFYRGDYGRKIVKTINSGISYQTLDSFNAKSLEGVSNNGLTIMRNNPNILTASIVDNFKSYDWDSFGLFVHISFDNGNSWSQIAEEQTKTGKILYVEDSYISYLTQVNGINPQEGLKLVESFDYGLTWSESIVVIPDNAQPDYQSISSLDETTFIFYDYGSLLYYYSINKGQTWTPFNLPIHNNGTFYNYKFKSLEEIYAWGQMDNWPTEYDYFLYKSLDSGQTWTQIVNIPDNNGVDLGAFAINTFFGSDFAIVSTGGNSYFKIDLNENTYSVFPFTHPNGSVYINENELMILDDNNWVLHVSDFFPYLITTNNQGQSWQEKFCQICGKNWLYNEMDNELILYSKDHLKIERLISYTPKIPIIFGNRNPVVESTEDYFIPVDFFSETTWELLSGGVLITQPNTSFYTATINWTEEGQHVLRAKRVNACGESEYNSIIVNIENLDLEKDKISTTTVYPNPFINEIYINLSNEIEDLNIEVYNSIGSQIKNYTIVSNGKTIKLDNLEHLSTGVYFLSITDNNNKSNRVFKMIK
ncbi:T9SS type A sorting domain-containing protein [Flavobacterium sp.]|uniref:T9SS type A sorting domain-containing protein n=1 Tax=Flavobacterium sp. TaxID=239 RepID=UPI002FD947F7